MTIVRTEHSKTNPYVMLSKKALEDVSLSWAAKGLWAYLISRPDNWEVSVSHLAKTFGQQDVNGASSRGQGKDAIYSLLNELSANGYAELLRHRNGGTFVKAEWVIREFKECSPQRAQPYVVQPDGARPGTNKEEERKKNERNDDGNGGKPPEPPTSSSFCEEFIEDQKIDESAAAALRSLEPAKAEVVIQRFGVERARGFKTNASSCIQWLVSEYDRYTDRSTNAQKQAQEIAKSQEASKYVDECRSLARAISECFPRDKFCVLVSDLYISVSRIGSNQAQIVNFTESTSKQQLAQLALLADKLK